MDPGLREELLDLAATDQAARKRLDRHPRLGRGVPEYELTPAERADVERLRAVDTANTARMKTIIQEHGWPGRSLVGDDGAAAAWLLAQHADRDPAFQRACLELLGQAVAAGEADPSHLAYLTDRVLVAEGKQQRYGTQVMLLDGAWQPRPLADPQQVDDRRRQVGLEPLVDYLHRFEQLYPQAQGGDEQTTI